MVEKMKTTVYLDADDYRRLKAIAREEGSSPAELIREAIALYTKSHSHSQLPSSIGAGESGSGTLAEESEDLLEGFGCE